MSLRIMVDLSNRPNIVPLLYRAFHYIGQCHEANTGNEKRVPPGDSLFPAVAVATARL